MNECITWKWTYNEKETRVLLSLCKYMTLEFTMYAVILLWKYTEGNGQCIHMPYLEQFYIIILVAKRFARVNDKQRFVLHFYACKVTKHLIFGTFIQFVSWNPWNIIDLNSYSSFTYKKLTNESNSLNAM